MLISQQGKYDAYAKHCNWPQPKNPHQCGQKAEHHKVKSACDPERVADATVAGDGMQTGLLVEIKILTGIKHVEAADPERHSASEQKNSRIKRTAYRDPGRSWSDSQRKSQDHVRPASPAFGIGVKKQHCKRERRKQKCDPVQFPGRGHEYRCRNDDKFPDKTGLQ